jgi:hypothetical protein
MKILAIAMNVLAILFLGFASPWIYSLSRMQVALALTELDRAECFNDEKLKAMGRSELVDPRSPEFGDYLIGTSKGPAELVLVVGVIVAALNILFLLVVGHREPKSPGTAEAAPGPVIRDA